MAKKSNSDGQTVASLFLELGLDLSQLQADFLAADKTVLENVGRLNREKNIVKLRMEADIAGLDKAKDAAKILEIQQAALNQQLALTKDRMILLGAAHKQIASNANSTALVIQNAERAFLREKIAVAQLEQQLRELSNQKVSPQPVNSLLSGYQGLKGNVVGTLQEISGAFSQLKDATSLTDSAITSTLGVISKIPAPVAKATLALAGLPIVLKGIENAFLDVVKAAAASGDSFYVMSRGFQMSFADTSKFVTMCKIAGADVNEVATAVKRAQQQIVKGGADSKGAQELRRYGESAYDASGRLKNLNEMVLTFTRAMEKAQAEGREAEFILRTFRNASGDVITTLEDAVGNYEAAEKIIKSGLANPKLAHDVQGLFNTVNTQSEQIGANFWAALFPAAEKFVPKLTERMKGLAQVMADNKDVIREFGHDVGEIFLSLESGAEKVISVFGTVAKATYSLKKSPYQDELVERFKNDLDIGSVDDLIKKAQGKAYDVIKGNALLYAQTKAKYEPIYRALADVQAEIKKKQKEADETVATTLSGETLKYQAEAKSILDKLNLNDYQKKIYDIRAWENELLQESEKTEAERAAVRSLTNAKIAEADKELADKLQEIRESVAAADKTALEKKLDAIEKERQAWLKAGMEEAEATELAEKKKLKARYEAAEKAQQYIKDAADIEYSLTHTAFEKQLRDIEQWQEAQLKKAETAEEVAGIIKDSAAKEAEAFEREVDRIKGKVQSLEDKIFAQEHSQYENDLRKLAQERYQLYQERIYSPDMIERYYQGALGNLQKRAAKGGDYTKSPEGAMQRGGNGIMVIGADQIIDDGKLNQSIGLITDENEIRGRLINTLDDEARAAVERTQSLRNNFQNLFQASGAVGDKTIIQGDQVTQMSLPDLKAEMAKEMSQISHATPVTSTQEIETVLTPLNSISNAVDSILAELRNRQPEQANVSLNNHIDLGGAYVFDNALKQSLVDDITSKVVSAITSAVQSATSRSNYGYSS